MRALRDHICVAASNGLEALRLLSTQAFDLVITDVDMPVMNGLDFYRCARERFPGLKVIFRTGSTFPDLATVEAPIVPKEWPLSLAIDVIESYIAFGGVPPRDAGQGEALSQVGGR
jgi:CheY-like chemotaxis protein